MNIEPYSADPWLFSLAQLSLQKKKNEMKWKQSFSHSIRTYTLTFL